MKIGLENVLAMTPAGNTIINGSNDGSVPGSGCIEKGSIGQGLFR
jgi:hypothetical protein